MSDNKNILITGSTGLLGLSVIKQRPPGTKIVAGYYNFPKKDLPALDISVWAEFDITDKKEVFKIFEKAQPYAVIHAASIGNVDHCERNNEAAWHINVEGSRIIIEACRQYGSKMVFMSSNAVFDGENPPYCEKDEPNPIDYYGKTKLRTERDLGSSGIRYAAIRLMTMYGWNHPRERQNPVTWVLENLKNSRSINVVDDIYNNHLFADNAAQAVWAVILKGKEGIYNIAGSQVVSRYELAIAVADVFGLDKGLIKPVNSAFFASLAPRPKNTSYRIDKMENELGVKGLDIKKGLMAMRDNPPEGWKYERL